MELRARLAINHPGVASVQNLAAHQAEVVGVGHFADELAPLLPGLLFFRLPLLLLAFRLVLALIGQLLNSFLFLDRVFLVERLVVFFNQACHRLAVELHDFVGLRFRGLDLAAAIQFVRDFAVDVGVVALLLVVIAIVLRHYAGQRPHLLR